MPSLNLIHSGNMNITSANLSSAGTLDVRYEPNNTGAVTGFTFSPPEGSEFVCGETYTITAVPLYSGNVLTETFVVSGVDVAGVPRSDNSVLRQGFDSDLTHYGLSLSSLGATILDSSVTSTYLEVVIRLDNDEYAEIDIQPEGGDVFVYPIDNISGGDVPVVLATSITIVVESAITDSGIATAEYSPDNATVQLTYSSSNPNLATINPYTGQITVLADGEVQFCVTDSVSSLSDCKTVTVEKSPEPGVTGITSLTLSVAEEIVGTGIAIPVYSPSGAEVSLVFTSSNPSLATIDSGGNITVLDNGRVTFCVTDELSGLRDCKTVSVRKAKYITNLTILVDDAITLYGTASAIYTPSDGTVSLVYTSSDPDIASIDLITGEITVNRTGMVTFCVRDLYTNLTDCKEVYAKGPDTFVQLVYNVTSTSEPTLLFSEHSCCGDKWSDFSNYIYYKGVSITPNTKSYTFPETGEQTVYVDFKTHKTNGKLYLNNCIFRNNNKLVKVKFPADYNAQGTGSYTFIGCRNLREVDLSCFTEIDYACFANCYSLTSITIPNVQIIGEASFYSTDLKNVYGPKVRLIGRNAFKYSLEAAAFPNLLTAEPGAFAYSKLAEFTVPSSTTSVTRVFEHCDRLKNLTFEGTTPPGNSFGLTSGLYSLMSIWVPCESINAYKSWLMSDTDSIPLNGYSIRSKVRCVEQFNPGVITATYDLSVSRRLIRDSLDSVGAGIPISSAGATGGTQTVVSITDTEGNEIGYTAPAGAPTIYTVNITIDLNAANGRALGPMFGSTGLISVTLPEGLNNIGNCMFVNCPGLRCLEIPSTVTTVNNLAFYGSGKLLRLVSLNPTEPNLVIYTAGSNTYTPFYGMSNNGVLYTPSGSSYSNWMKTSSSKPYDYLGTKGWNRADYVPAQNLTLNLPSSIVDFAYASATVAPLNASVSLSYESSNTSILKAGDKGELIVYRNGEVTITVVDGISGLRDSKTVYVRAGEFTPTAQTIGLLVNVSSTAEQWLYFSSSSYARPADFFQRIYLEDGTEIPFGSGTYDTIVKYAFQQTGLTKVFFELKRADVGSTSSVFYGKVEKMYISDGVRSIRCGFNNGAMSTVIIPQGVTDINLAGTAIESLVVPSSVTISDANGKEGCIFNGCRKLRDIVFTGPISLRTSFANCSSLENVDISYASSVFSATGNAENGLFYNCTSLRSVTFPDSMEGAFENYYMFAGCSSLEEIALPSYFTTLGKGLFYMCNNLRNVTLPDGLEEIEQDAFYSATTLSDITLPSSVTFLEFAAFDNCPNLGAIYSYAEEAPGLGYNSATGDSPFVNVKNAGVLHYLYGASNYSSWLQSTKGRLGKYNWTGAADL